MIGTDKRCDCWAASLAILLYLSHLCEKLKSFALEIALFDATKTISETPNSVAFWTTRSSFSPFNKQMIKIILLGSSTSLLIYSTTLIDNGFSSFIRPR